MFQQLLLCGLHSRNLNTIPHLVGASKSAANAEASKDAALRNSQKAAEKGDKKLARAKSPVAKKIAAKKDKALRKIDSRNTHRS